MQTCLQVRTVNVDTSFVGSTAKPAFKPTRSASVTIYTVFKAMLCQADLVSIC